MNIGERIKARREYLNITQEELAHKVGYKSRTSINKIELGLTRVSETTLVAISKALETTPSDLLGWDDGLRNFDELDELEKDVVRALREASPELRDAILRVARRK